MKKKTIIISGIILFVLITIIWTLMNNKKIIDSHKETRKADMDIAVTVVPVEKKIIDNNLQLTGIAEANRSVTVSSKAMGNIIQINFKLGDYITKGNVLARVDDEYKRLALETAQLNHDKYKEDYNRYQVLYKGEAISETQFRDMKLTYTNASIQLEHAKQQLQDTQIIAPYSGYIVSKDVEVGAYVNVGSAIAGIIDISQLRVTLSVSENNVYSLHQGQETNVTTSIYPKANYRGNISSISSQGNDAHTYPVEIVISNSKEFPLKAGTHVNVLINTDKSIPSALIIPREAIVSSVKEPSVYVVENGIAKLIKVTIGHNANSYLEILSGLKEKDLVVTNGQINLIDGAKVSIVKNN